MFTRKKKNKSGSVSIQIIQKIGRRNKVLKTVGCAHTKKEEILLSQQAKNEMEQMQGLISLFVEPEDLIIDSFVASLSNDQLQIVGPQLVLGKIYDKFGYNSISGTELFKDLVLCRLSYPGSKLKTVKYFKRHLSKDISVHTIYRYLDELHSKYKDKLEKLTFEYTKRILKGRIGVVFYDMTTLYFEASEEDEFRIPGYSKDGKHNEPQILLGLLVGKHGYPIGYQLFEGNKSETKTLIPVLESFQEKFNIKKPIIVADAALLSQKNIDALTKENYQYILGGRIRNESDAIKDKILSLNVTENYPKEIQHHNGRLIVTFSSKREKKDQHNRRRGLARLEKKVKNGKLTKQHINNRGYNKYLSMKGETTIEIDYQKFEKDSVWDGLKGYVTNTSLTKKQTVETYQQLWQIEKAFRISKTDLKIRPIYHRLKHRIEAHICICFIAYAIYKEFERLIQNNKLDMSVEKAIEQLKEILQLTYRLPKSKQLKIRLLKLTEIQSQLLKIVD